MTRKIRRTWHRKTAALAATMMAMSFGGMAYAMPQGETIRSGHGEITRQDKEMTVNQDTKHLAIDWKGFDINNDERVRFNQPDAASIALNRVTGDAKTFIDGSLTANGQVFVINPNGVLFGQNASVDVGSLVASTARVSDSQMEAFGNGDGTLNLELADDSTAKVINEGTIRAEGGLVALHAAAVENSGTIANEGGKIALAAAKNINLSADTAGKLNFTVDGTLAKASTLNSGVLKADGGYIVMTAKQAGDVMSTVVNNTGTIEAKTLRQNEKGEILLDGGESGIVEINGTLDASGMEAGQSAGQIKAIGAETHVKDGAALLARGTVDGGLIETSGDYLEIGDTVNIDAAGETGKAGEWLLDPLEVVISNSQPSGSSSVTNGNTDGSYNSSNDASGTASRNKTTWVNSNTVNRLLNKGTAVSVQATDANKVASITLGSAINKTSGADTSLTLEAQRNITVNAGITSTSGALDVNLHSDTDGDGLGAVLINADIATNGGTFTSGSGTKIKSGSVGTYFGNQGKMGDRTINTNGGAINLYGDVAIGLNGGTLTLDTQKGDSASGAVTITGTVDSGNSYKRVASGLEGWEDFVKSYYDEVMRTVPTYTLKSGAKTSRASESSPRYILYSDGTVSRITSGRGYKESDLQATGKTITLSSYDELSASQKSNLSSYLAAQSITWNGAKAMAQGATEGTNHTGDTYLATITTALENSLASPPEEYQLIVGGRGSGNATRLNPNPADPEYPDGYYWVTGPEGMANNGKGTKFAYNDGSAVDNYYVKWNYSYSQDTKQKEKEPNNSGPMVSIGFGTASNWDDVVEGAGTIRGFVQEKNLEHSGLVINAGDSQVDIAGNIGNSVALKNVEINAGDVAIGSGAHYTGIVHADEGVSITGKNVTVGDRITADTMGVDIQATGNINVDGITAHEKINLMTTGESGAIVLNHTHNDGALITESTDNDAVIIDARGTDGSFQNLTTAEKAITTGEGGNWKVYSASPDRDTFGTNLNSETTARWHASSTGGNGLDTYAETENTNKYIFQVQPTLTVTADNKTKVYGETVDLTAQEKAEFIGKDGNPHDVTGYTDAFQEVSEGGSIMDRYSGSYKLSSAGQAASATRTNGDRRADDKEFAIYDINVENQSLQGLEGYGVATLNKGELKITRRTVVLNGSASQTYGDATLKNKNVYAETGTAGQGLTNGDELNKDAVEYTISDSGNYTASKNAHTKGVTADAGTYNDELLFSNVHFTNNADANYTVTGVGNIYVNKAPLTVNRTGYETTYGTVITDDAAHRFTTWSGLVNGDVDDIYINYGNYGGAYKDNNTRTNNAGTYTFHKKLQSASNVLRNYEVNDTQNNWVTIKPYELTDADILNATYTTTYGSANKFGTAKLRNINGDGELDLAIVDSNALTHEKPRITQDVGKNIYNTVVSLDAIYGADGFDLKNYTLNGKALDKNDRMTIANSASVKPADLTVKVGNVWTNYGEAFDPDEYDYSIQNPANGDDAAALKSELGKLDYVNNGIGTDGRATQDVGHYALEGTADQKLSNYTIHFENGDAEVKPLDVQNNLNEYFTNATYTTKYGERDEFRNATFKDVNGNGEKTLKIIGSSALTGDRTGRITKSVGDNYNTIVSLEGFTAQDLINYGLTGLTQLTFNDSASVTRADLTVKVGNVWTTYGTPFNKDAYDYSVTNPTNGDSADKLKAAIGNLDYTNEGIGENGKATKDVGHYDLLGATDAVLNNYNIHVEKGDAEVKPYTITKDDIVNLDGSPLYTTKYGQQDPFGKATFTGVNGDGMYELAITDSSALTGASEGQVTYDVGDKVYNTTIKLSDAMNGNYQFADGAKSATFDNTASVTPAELKLTTDDIVTEYGTIELANTKVEGFTNGDEMPDAGFIFDYGEYNDYGGAYLNNNTKTNNVKQRSDGTFEAYDPFETTIKLESRPDFLNNYTITSNKATATITPKDVTFFVTGTGKTTSDVTYTENPLVDSQLAYGEHANTLYTLDQDLGNNQYSILTYIDGQKVTTGDVIGNYRFNYEGLATITPDEPNPPTKPDIDHNNPSNIDGTASWTNSMGNHGIPGVDRVAGLASAELPFFKVQNGEVSQYGTYSVATDPDKVTLEATGKRLLEPNQPKTQYREYTKELTTAAGTGTFRMIYDGSTFRIKPVGMMAKNVIASGDATQNVELYAQALHAGFNEMGILLEDLDGVYVHFDENE